MIVKSWVVSVSSTTFAALTVSAELTVPVASNVSAPVIVSVIARFSRGSAILHGFGKVSRIWLFLVEGDCSLSKPFQSLKVVEKELL